MVILQIRQCFPPPKFPSIRYLIEETDNHAVLPSQTDLLASRLHPAPIIHANTDIRLTRKLAWLRKTN